MVYAARLILGIFAATTLALSLTGCPNRDIESPPSRKAQFGADWIEDQRSVPWSPRLNGKAAVFNGMIYFTGGSDGGEGRFQEVWRSADGLNWDLAPTPPWAGRSSHGLIVFNDALWVLGGATPEKQNDVWYTLDGDTWQLATDDAPWTRRLGFGVAAFNGRLWVIGGVGPLDEYFDDIWYTEDGVNWLQSPSITPWGARGDLNIVQNFNLLWQIGGRYNTFDRVNDVWWSADGQNWQLATADAGWEARAGASVAVHENTFYITGGLGVGGTLLNDTWQSTDGETWTPLSSGEENTCKPNCEKASVVFNGEWLLLGGMIQEGVIAEECVTPGEIVFVSFGSTVGNRFAGQQVVVRAIVSTEGLIEGFLDRNGESYPMERIAEGDDFYRFEIVPPFEPTDTSREYEVRIRVSDETGFFSPRDRIRRSKVRVLRNLDNFTSSQTIIRENQPVDISFRARSHRARLRLGDTTVNATSFNPLESSASFDVSLPVPPGLQEGLEPLWVEVENFDGTAFEYRLDAFEVDNRSHELELSGPFKENGEIFIHILPQTELGIAVLPHLTIDDFDGWLLSRVSARLEVGAENARLVLEDFDFTQSPSARVHVSRRSAVDRASGLPSFYSNTLDFQLDDFFDPPQVVMMREIVQGSTFVPGEALDVVLRIENLEEDLSIGALGAVEILSEGWIATIGNYPGAPPIARMNGDRFEMGFITVPSFPVEIRYTLQPPVDESRDQVFVRGQVLYRANSPELRSLPVETTITREIVSMTRELLQGTTFMPGEAFDVVLRIENLDEAVSITALGLVEELPDGWTATIGNYPGAPPIAEMNEARFEMGFTTVPPFPLEVRYTLQPPANETREQVYIRGQALYRVDGPERLSRWQVTELSLKAPEN